MGLLEMKGGSQSWGHMSVSTLRKSQPCYQGGSFTAAGIKVRLCLAPEGDSPLKTYASSMKNGRRGRSGPTGVRREGGRQRGRDGGTQFVLLSFSSLVSCKFVQHKVKNCICDFASLCHRSHLQTCIVPLTPSFPVLPRPSPHICSLTICFSFQT